MNLVRIVAIILTFTSCYGEEKGKKLNDVKEKQVLEQVIFDHLITNFEESEGEALHQFLDVIKNKNYNDLYEMFDDRVKKIQSKDEMILYFSQLDQFYGSLLNYNQSLFKVENRMGFGKIASVMYDIEFKKYKGRAKAVFSITGKDSFKVLSFDMMLNDYTTVSEFDYFTLPLINSLKRKDVKNIYQLTSAKFKEYNSVSEYETSLNKVLSEDVTNLKMFRHKFNVQNGLGMLSIYYQLSDSNKYLQLLFVKRDDKFELEAINLHA